LPPLLRQAQQGDRRALQLLFCIHLPQLTQWARQHAPEWVRRRGEIDDLVQRTMLNVLRRLKQLDPAQEGQLQSYLRQAFVNLIRDEYRRARRVAPAKPLDDHLVAPDPSPLRRTMAVEEMRRYRSALGRLSPAFRAAIVGRFERGCSYAQLALVLRRPTPGAARLAVARAVDALAREMRRTADDADATAP
jgi:RNA polymerase sigma factor (sigma-70 family)